MSMESLSHLMQIFPLPSNVTRSSNYIGKSNWSGDPLFGGYMHDLQFYNTALTASQVASIYSSGTASTPTFNDCPSGTTSNLVSTALTSRSTINVTNNSSATALDATSTINYGTNVTFRATVTSGTPGTVTFKDGNLILNPGGTSLTSGIASFTTTTPLSGGTHTITAIYNGDNTYASSSTSTTQTVRSVTSTTVTSNNTTITFGGNVTFTATVASSGSTATGATRYGYLYGW